MLSRAAHRQKMHMRRFGQQQRQGTVIRPMEPTRNDPHFPHTKARETARRLRQMEARNV